MVDDSSAIHGGLIGGILAGGRSSRMGECKATLSLPSGEVMIDRMISTISPHCGQVLVSVSQADQAGFSGSYDTIVDSVDFRGPINGIVQLLAAAAALQSVAVLVVSVDLPYLASADLEPLISTWRATPTEIVVASSDGVAAEPLIAIYPCAYHASLQTTAAGDERSLMRWLGRNPHQLVEIRPQAAKSINTPSQWKEVHGQSEYT